MTAIIPFHFESSEVRVLDQDGEPWFVLADVCSVLEIGHTATAALRLEDDEKAGVVLTDTSSNGVSQKREFTIINESGLWNLVIRSDKPQAKTFRKWLTSEVIPQIRKTGAYARPLTPGEQLLASVQLSVELERRTAAIEAKQVQTAGIAHQALAVAQQVQVQLGVHETSEELMYTVSHYCELMGVRWPVDTLSMLGKRAVALCEYRGVLYERISNKPYGKVNLHRVSILRDVFDRYVAELEDYAS